MNISIVAAIAYGVLSIVGGIFGYVKTQSKASIISGSISGALLIAAGVAQLQGIDAGKIAGIVIAGLLVVVFVVRLIKTKKFMPAGLMIIAGLATLAAMLIPAALIPAA
jgi:uncharacterized membrane protein (UPF0136 family)